MTRPDETNERSASADVPRRATADDDRYIVQHEGVCVHCKYPYGIGETVVLHPMRFTPDAGARYYWHTACWERQHPVHVQP